MFERKKKEYNNNEKKSVHLFVLRATIPNVPIELPFHEMHRYDR